MSACFTVNAQETVKDSIVANTIKTDSIVAQIPIWLEDIDFRIRGLDRYKLYPTENIYTFLKLDTRTGYIEQLQWGLGDDHEGTFIINKIDLSWDTGCGTFELYSTLNMYQFILLDKVNGTTWHVQWGKDDAHRWIRIIH